MNEVKSNAELNIQQLARERLEEREYGYSELCKVLGMKAYKSGNGGQKAQLNKIAKAREIEEVPGVWRGRSVTRYKIGKIKDYCDEIKDYYDKIKESCNIERNHWSSKGIYSIVLNDIVYIGKTESGFRARFMQHHKNYNNQSEKTKKLLIGGGKFTPIHFMNEVEDPILFLMVEDLFINMYKDMGYNVINERTNMPIKKPKKIKPKKKKIKVFEKDLDKIIEFAINNCISIEIF